jgi:cyclopropane-fatty-acyl-phospholipid synthase
MRDFETVSVTAAPSDPGGAAARTRAFFDALFPPPRDFRVRLWDGEEFGGETGHRYTIVLNRPGAARRMFALPIEVALAEAYMAGDFDLEGDFFEAFGLKDRARAAVATTPRVLELLRLRRRLPDVAANDDSANDAFAAADHRRARLTGRAGTRDRDRDAIRHHYAVGNDFYRLWLDRRMVYSCGYFPAGGESLDAAQELKLDYICRKLRLREGQRFLDIGSGWGALCIHAAERFGVHAAGITLSEEQYVLATERVAAAGLTDRVRIRLLDYRDLKEDFDRIASVGMFEHVPDHAEYFEHVHRLLAPRGLFLNHAIAAAPHAEPWGAHSVGERLLRRRVLGTGLVRERYIFPDGHLVPVSEANLVAERAGFEVRDVENLREHYALTLRQWLRRLESRRAEAIAVAGDWVYRAWRIYLAASALEFERGGISVNQTLFARPENGDAGLPLSRAGLYSDRG